MKSRIFSSVLIISLAIALGACGDSTDFLPGGDQYKIDIISLADGEILSPAARASLPGQNTGNYIFFRIRGDENKQSTLTLVINLYNSFNESVARFEKTAPAIQVDSPIEIPSNIAPGQYELDLVLMKGDVLLAREKRIFFFVWEPLSIQGILSFPLVIYPSRTVLLIVDMPEPVGLDPYFKWTQGKKVIAAGPLSEGYNQILWEAPGEDGVYSVNAEVYPFVPEKGLEFKFKSPYSASAELFISPKEKESTDQEKSNLCYDLFDIYISALKERERIKTTDANAAYPKNLKRPYPVIFGDSIGMRFNGQAGFVCPDLIFPIRATPFKPFTLSLGMTLEGSQEGRQILSLVTFDGRFSIDYFFDENSELVVRFKVNNEEFFFPSSVKKLDSGIRYLVELTIAQEEGGVRTEWKLNGAKVSRTEKSITLENRQRKGYTVVGGENGIRCVVDTLDIILE